MSSVSQFPHVSSLYLFMSMALFNPVSTFSPLSIIPYFLTAYTCQVFGIQNVCPLCLFGRLFRAVGEGVQRGEHRSSYLLGEEIHQSDDDAQSR